MKDLRKICVLGMGLLGSSVSMSILRSMPCVKVVGYSHRRSTRQKAKRLEVASEIASSLAEAVSGADMVILATPVQTFERIFGQITPLLKPGAIVTDVGSTKSLVHRWASKNLPRSVCFVGSHPIAGSEQRGVEFARDDLLSGARCILTRTASTSVSALKTVAGFWTGLGCRVEVMTPARHDRILGLVSHLPHITAASLVNANSIDDAKYAGKGFMDASRIASGPENVWVDILLTNRGNCDKGISRLIRELKKLQAALRTGNQKKIEELLHKARTKRQELIRYKIGKRELF